MLPMKFVRKQLGELLAADVDSLAPATANKVALIIELVTPTENLVIGDLTFATFTGGAAKSGASGAQQSGTRPSTGEQVITILSPVGGWRWECTAAPSPEQVIYGYALVDDGLTELWAIQLLSVPVTIRNVGDYIDLGAVEMTFVLQPLS